MAQLTEIEMLALQWLVGLPAQDRAKALREFTDTQILRFRAALDQEVRRRDVASAESPKEFP